MVDTRTKSAEVEYANDLETTKYSSGFPRVPLSESYTGVNHMHHIPMHLFVLL